MENLFITTLSLLVFFLVYIGIRYFPSERFQFLATIPYKPLSEGKWFSLNITFYGLFNAIAYTIGSMVVAVLLLSVGVTFFEIALIMVIIFLICIPASKIIAYIIEKNKTGFTVGGAVFIGVLVSPLAIYLGLFLSSNKSNFTLLFLPIISAMAIGYIFGEGVGRIGCLSFGCCYGKSVDELKSRILKKFFSRFYTIYTGRLKKAQYASNLCNKKTVPVQSIGIILYNFTGLIGVYLFLKGNFYGALIVTVFVSQIYRFFSEFLRDDYRGEGKISPYQKMALLNVIVVLIYSVIFKNNGYSPLIDLNYALQKIFEIKTIIFFILIFAITFIYTGVSTATYSIVTFRLSSKVRLNKS